jgi:hypothetical protein
MTFYDTSHLQLLLDQLHVYLLFALVNSFKRHEQNDIAEFNHFKLFAETSNSSPKNPNQLYMLEMTCCYVQCHT